MQSHFYLLGGMFFQRWWDVPIEACSWEVLQGKALGICEKQTHIKSILSRYPERPSFDFQLILISDHTENISLLFLFALAAFKSIWGFIRYPQADWENSGCKVLWPICSHRKEGARYSLFHT